MLCVATVALWVRGHRRDIEEPMPHVSGIVPRASVCLFFNRSTRRRRSRSARAVLPSRAMTWDDLKPEHVRALRESIDRQGVYLIRLLKRLEELGFPPADPRAAIRARSRRPGAPVASTPQAHRGCREGWSGLRFDSLESAILTPLVACTRCTGRRTGGSASAPAPPLQHVVTRQPTPLPSLPPSSLWPSARRREQCLARGFVSGCPAACPP